MATVVAMKSKTKRAEPHFQPVNALKHKRHTLLASFIFVLTIIAFYPVLQNDFVNWDDDRNLLDNLNFRGLGWAQLHWMFTTFHMTLYRPLTWMTLGLDYLFWGMNPFGYHLTSLVLHATNAVLVYLVAIRLLNLGFSSPKVTREFSLELSAGCAALIFALHPLRVEPVAWASARNDVLSGFFFLATILCYLRSTIAASTGTLRLYWLTLAVIVYALSLLSKAIGMTLPVVLLVLDVYPLKRLSADPKSWFESAGRRIWLEKGAFFLLAVGAAAIALIAKQRAAFSLEELGAEPRLAQSVWGLTFYIWKTMIPIGLSPLYALSSLSSWIWPVGLSAAAVLIISITLFAVRRRWSAGLASWVCYVVMVAPVLGIAQSGPQSVADRYTYLSCLPWALLAGSGLHSWRIWARGDQHTRASMPTARFSVFVVWH